MPPCPHKTFSFSETVRLEINNFEYDEYFERENMVVMKYNWGARVMGHSLRGVVFKLKPGEGSSTK